MLKSALIWFAAVVRGVSLLFGGKILLLRKVLRIGSGFGQGPKGGTAVRMLQWWWTLGTLMITQC